MYHKKQPIFQVIGHVKNSSELNNKLKTSSTKNESDEKSSKKNEESTYENIDNLIQLINKNNPKFLEQLELLDFIKSGSSGKFYKARYKKKNIEIGCKFYINKKKESQNREITFLKNLKHKKVITLFSYFKINEEVSVSIEELAKLGDLYDFQIKMMKRRYYSETLLCYISYQILEALIYIHNNKVVHLDIKPGNIVIDTELNIKLTDFSVSASYKEYDDNILIKYPFTGTGKFISPEILGKKGIYAKDSNKLDIYSLGIMLFQLAYNIYPYELETVDHSNYKEILNILNKQKELIFPDEIIFSNMFKDFLKSILEIDINKRSSIYDAINHPWIQGGKIIINEKEKINFVDRFLIELMTDGIDEFNEYIK